MKKMFIGSYFSLHYSFIFLMLFSVLTRVFWIVLLYFLFLVLHELVHALVAKKLGYALGRIKLLATGAVLEAESDDFSFKDEIKIAISAPLFNLFIAIFLLGIWWIFPESYNYTQDVFVINLAIFSFNILPIFPLDGGRVLLAYLSLYLDRKTALLVTKSVAILLSLCIFMLFVFSLFSSPNFSLGIIAITLFVGAITEDKKAMYKKILFFEKKQKKVKKQGVEVRHIIVDKNLSQAKLMKFIDARFFTIFLIVDEFMNIVQTIPEDLL